MRQESKKTRLEGKRWSKEWEKPIYEEWKRIKAHKFDEKSRKPIFSIDTPPPYVNTPIHIGHATTYVLMDMFARFRRMTGYNVIFPLGLDRNGLPIEMAAQKRFNISIHDTPREKFIEYCKKVLEEASDISTRDFLRLGISFNSWDFESKEPGKAYYTDSEDYRRLTQETFIDLWKKGLLIYQAKRLNNYCPGCRTTIADSEIERKKTQTFLNYVKFRVKGAQEDIVIATTRPELLCTAALIIYNPKDKRYKHLKGKTAITPIFNIEVKIQEDREADMKFGTGLVFMSASAGDQDAVRFLRKKNIEPIQAVGEDGKMLPVSKMLSGLDTKKARAKIIELLKEENLLQKQEHIEHAVPICERSKDVIEFVAMPEYYLKQLDFKSKIVEMANKISFYSPKSRQMLFDWIDSISMDWAISRRRYYATEIPLWYCRKCEKPFIPPKGKYYRPWKENPPGKCKCGSTEFTPETRVFDTWFDSSISPLYILKYASSFFSKTAPVTLRPQGKEIIRTWLFYTLLRCYQLTGKSIFKDVWINYHILDSKGTKMSKSLGNVINPREILDKYGAEPFRLWAAVEGNLAETDFRCSFERIEGAGKFLTKLWNISRFISMFPFDGVKPKLIDTDKWILNEVRELVAYSKKKYESYNFHNPVTRIKGFMWETFASHYIELVKTRAYNENEKFSKEEQESAIYTLNCTLDILLKLLSPVIPFISHKIYKDLRGKNIHSESFPKSGKKEKIPFSTPDILNLNSTIWKLKKDKGLSLKTEIKQATVPENLKSVEKDIKEAHNIKEMKYGKSVKIVLWAV